MIYSRCGDVVYLRAENVEEETLHDMHRRYQRAKLISGLKLLIFCWFSWCEIHFKFALNTQSMSLSYLLLLFLDFSAQGLLQTPGGGQVGKGGGGSDGKGGRFLLPFPELGPKAGGVWC